MEKNNSGARFMITVLLALMFAGNVAAGKIYTCWGGCLNQCFLETGKKELEKFPCYFKCLGSCIPRYPTDYRYYCHVGCSAELCLPLTYDGVKMEQCLGKCTDLCSRI